VGAVSSARLTIGELADAVGMTVRNIRNHQSRGLLPPPELEARTGYYGAEHIERLRLIKAMQADGFNLEAIRKLLGFHHALTAPFAVEAPAVTSDLGGLEPAPLIAAGLVERLDDGRYRVASPALLRAAQEAVRGGVSLQAALDASVGVRESCEAMARTFIELFVEELWRPQRRPEDTVQAVEALRPVATATVHAHFQRAMAAEVERAFARELDPPNRG
jgi:DNA-binding transcriptional MerR regulator